MQADEYQEQIAGRMAEGTLQTQVEQAALFYGWRAYHTHDSRRSRPGFPDLVLVRPPRLVFAELKTSKGRVTTDQQAWLDDLTTIAEQLAEVGQLVTAPTVEVYLWRPIDMVRNTILEVLR